MRPHNGSTTCEEGPDNPIHLARLLDAADRDHRPLPGPLRLTDGVQAAYAVQQHFVSLRSSRLGSPTRGYKVALTSAATQAALSSGEPAVGELLAADILPSPAFIALARVFSPVVEVELVFRLRQDLADGATVDEVVSSTEVAAALECPDSRYADWFGGAYPALPLQAVISDNCLTGLLVLGPVWLPADSLDLRSVTARLFADDEILAEGDARNVLDHPASSVVWLSGHLAARGVPLRAGTLVSTGTLTPPVPFRPGTVRAELSGGLGEVLATLR